MCCSLYTSFLGCSLCQGTGRGESIARQKIKVCLCEKSIFLVCGACACACVWCVCMVARACAAFFSPGMVLSVCVYSRPISLSLSLLLLCFLDLPSKKKNIDNLDSFTFFRVQRLHRRRRAQAGRRRLLAQSFQGWPGGIGACAPLLEPRHAHALPCTCAARLAQSAAWSRPKSPGGGL